MLLLASRGKMTPQTSSGSAEHDRYLGRSFDRADGEAGAVLKLDAAVNVEGESE